jgi:6,7-dimethyl-8-ribityllumazine synthase
MALAGSNLLQIDKGTRRLAGAFIVLVKTEWNNAIVDQLEKACIDILGKNGIKNTVTITVPGAVEIPFGIKSFWDNTGKKKKPDAFIALGCVIRGGTPHFEYVCQAVTSGVMQLNLVLPVPTIFGVLTVDSEAQALERTGGPHGNKGEEAGAAAIKMIALKAGFSKKNK